ncbi:bifunctional glycoside hydrolase 114/ polysaccharide deacetylase family protein [Acidovorax sp.]|uniref:bifunctional glycoside hydrolase 114/ polysaccharide deacetylase family protein n=1 Tax=Acidovorax sp. TaxID=1872122 RepID=UPI00263336C8|nr:bifunctional glycoside hydrolase 114/ polysaccharide deacetylase family protein [Acidovorax sp.]
MPPADFRAFDLLVVDPGHTKTSTPPELPGTDIYAYVSVAEALPSRPDYKDIPAEWKMARNGDWKSDVIDQTPEQWPDFFATQVIAPLWKQGYRGFFLDTLDSYRLAAKFDEEAQQRGLVRVIETLHQRFPGIQLILNRGFEIVPRVRDKIRMVAAESLYQGWNARTQRYESVKEADRQWLQNQLRTIRERDGIPALVIDYVPPHDRALTRSTAARIQADGFIPWVTDSALSTIGIGSIEPMPRRVLIAYNGAETPALNYTEAHRFLQMPLNHMGYVVDFADIRNGIPPAINADRYAGVVTWFNGYMPEDKATPMARWLQARVDEQMPLLVLGSFGFLPPKALTQKLGIQPASPAGGAPQIVSKHAIMGYEVAPEPLQGPRFAWASSRGAPPGAEPLIELRDGGGQTMLGGAFMPWGGFLFTPFVTLAMPGTDYSRWVVDPFALLTKALRLPAIPVPDTTTENGRRLLFAHIDGDGFASLAELAGSPLAADAMRQVIEKYPHIPHAVSVVEAETAPHGLYPDMSPRLEEAARKIFKLPHVELASHTFSHPFLWDTSVRHGMFSGDSTAAFALNIPGYTVDLTREIVGSSEYINQRLAPPGKKVKILLWSGDTAPNAKALEITERAGLLNMNGGDTSITLNTPTLTEVGALGITKGGFLQVYAPITNENIYTNLWKGPFYGFERVLQTFAMTETPRRIKPVDIYYHTYSASKRAGINALNKVYNWAMAQPLHPVYPSEFIRKVRDWQGYALAREGSGWRVRGDGDLRTLRLPLQMGEPVMATSQGVAGWYPSTEGRYVHLTGGKATLHTDPAQQQSPLPYLHDANARLTAWKPSADGRSIAFTLTGHAPLEFSLGGMQDCQALANGRPLQAATVPPASGQPLRAYRLTHVVADLQIQCPAR